MSSIYVLEPPTNGRVILHTTVGAIDIELWSKEAPKACRNFVQLCMEGYYDGTIFHRVVKDFIAQGGDPTGSGSGGDSVYGAPFGLELHSRLRFNRRGLVAMACLQPGQNASQFFFTLAATPELEKHNTIFGQVAGNSLFNMLRLGECETDQQERPLYPHSVQRAEVVACPFGDVAPREEQLLLRRQQRQAEAEAAAASASSARRRPASEAKATKNFALLSFGDEAAEDEEQALAGRKAKKVLSSHDLLDDPRLSSETAPILPVAPTLDADAEAAAALTKSRADAAAAAAAEEADDADETRDGRLARLKREVAQMRRALHKAGPVVVPAEPPPPPPQQQQQEEDEKKKKKADEEEAEAAAAAAKRRKRRRGGGEVDDAKAAREAATLRLLAKFTAKMAAAGAASADDDADAADDADKGGGSSAAGLFSHVFLADSAPAPRRVIDASLAAAGAGGAAEADRYELDDPRNPMNKRRRKAAADKAAAAGGGGGRAGRGRSAAEDDLL